MGVQKYHLNTEIYRPITNKQNTADLPNWFAMHAVVVAVLPLLRLLQTVGPFMLDNGLPACLVSPLSACLLRYPILMRDAVPGWPLLSVGESASSPSARWPKIGGRDFAVSFFVQHTIQPNQTKYRQSCVDKSLPSSEAAAGQSAASGIYRERPPPTKTIWKWGGGGINTS